MLYLLVIILIIIILVICFYNIENNSSPNNSLIFGTFKKISGDSNQSPFFKNVKTNDGFDIIYFDKSNNIENVAHMKNNIVSHTNSKSTINHIIHKKDIFFDQTTGYAENKHGREDVHYKANHIYLRIDDLVYYQNTYFFCNGEISSAIYLKE